MDASGVTLVLIGPGSIEQVGLIYFVESFSVVESLYMF